LCLVVLKAVLSIQRNEAVNVKYIMITSILVVGGFLVGRNIFPLPTPHNNAPMVTEAQVFDVTNRPYKQIEETQNNVESEPMDDNLSSHVQSKTAISLDALKVENERLKSKLATLQSEKEKSQQHTAELAMSKMELQNRLIAAELELSKNGLSVDKLSLADIKDIVRSPFAEVIATSPGSMSDLAEYAKEKRNIEWAIQMEQRISDFIVTHELSYAVTLDKVECKSQTCQIAGFDKEDDSFSKIIEDLDRESWFELKGGSTFSGWPSDNGKMFYSIKKKNFY
jgi:hypothetical protein